MDRIPLVTLIMPAYNAESFIGEAISSVQAQTVKDWELMVVDDGSADDTMSVARRYAESDARITVHSMPRPSGSAYQPRKMAILMSRSEFVSPLDADDWIEPTCLEQLLDKAAESGAELVYPTMFRGDNGAELLTPRDASLYDGVHEGKDCVRLTLDGWRINANGGLIKRKCYLDAYERFGSDISYSCADELLTRQLLFIAPKVAFSPAKYFYRPNPASITRKRSLKLFDFLINNRELLEFTKRHYGGGSEEHMLAQRQNFHGVFKALRLLNEFDFSGKDKKAAWRMIHDSRKSVDVNFIRPHVSPRYMALLAAGLPAARMALKVLDPLMSAFKIGNYIKGNGNGH